VGGPLVVREVDAIVECHRMMGKPDYFLRIAVADLQALRRPLHQEPCLAARGRNGHLTDRDEERQDRRPHPDV